MPGKTAGSRAKKKVNKSQEIIKYHHLHPDAKPREIVSALNRRGMNITAQYVSTILFNYRKKLHEKNGSASGGRGRSSNIKGVSAKEIILAKQLVQQSGSIGAARRALDLYSDIIA